MISALSAFALATPIFGLSLSIDLPALELDAMGGVAAEIAAAPTLADNAGAASTSSDSDIAPRTVAAEAGEGDTAASPDVATLMARRAHYARIHRIFGLSTFAAMTVTVTLGTLQYANLYGFFAKRGDTRCVQGNAFFGQDACINTPVPHLTTALVTASLYYTTFGLSYAMPDPIGLSEGDSRPARRLRMHKRLRWAHFTGMALQMLLGTATANAHWFGLDRANDYRALQGLATVHLLSGYMTYATLTWAGALMTVH